MANGTRSVPLYALAVSWPYCLDMQGMCAIPPGYLAADPAGRSLQQGMQTDEGDVLPLQFLLQVVLRTATPISGLWITLGHFPTLLRVHVDDYTKDSENGSNNSEALAIRVAGFLMGLPSRAFCPTRHWSMTTCCTPGCCATCGQGSSYQSPVGYGFLQIKCLPFLTCRRATLPQNLTCGISSL